MYQTFYYMAKLLQNQALNMIFSRHHSDAMLPIVSA